MLVMQSIGETMTQKPPSNVLMENLTERGARNVAAMLKRRGYTQATIEDCRRKSPIEIAAYFEPLDEEAREELVRRIARAAGLQP
jgi:hypothetical protein